MNQMIGRLHTESNVDGIVHKEQLETLAQFDQEQKCEASCSDSSSDNDATQDMDIPATQVLAPTIADEDREASMPERLVAVSSVDETCASVAEPHQMTSGNAHAFPHEACTPSVHGPNADERSSLLKIQSPLKNQSPAELRSPLVTSIEPAVAPPTPLAPKEVSNDFPEEFRAKGAEGKFTKIFPAVANMFETGGWQIAYGHKSLFCAMPGVQFFNFKPNINVFDSKVKACWKFIQIAGEKETDTEDRELWEMLWSIAANDFGWFTMTCGLETWFVKPNTKFENFQPNETIFQTKKGAVLKCLAVEVGEIELGDSVEGHQVIAFAPREVQVVPTPAIKKAKTSLFKTPSPAVNRTTLKSGSSANFVTPAKHVSPGLATSSAKRKLSSSAAKLSAKSSASKKKAKTGSNVSVKRTTRKKTTKSVSDTASDISKCDEFNFTPSEFRCSFGIVYAKLQDEGWYHRSGMFEYDYFSPTYTESNKELKVNFFQSQADLEEFLKVSGTWKRIEDKLREEHETAVEEEREKALDRHHQRLEQQAARKRKLALYGNVPGETERKKPFKKATTKKTGSAPLVPQTLYQAEVEATIAAEAEDARLSRMPRLKFGTVLEKLVKRGWYYRPGRFEYDYFKPSANPKTAVAGEDRFESASALEVYLKTTGLWEEIAEEVAHEEQQYNQSTRLDAQERSTKRSKLESPPPAAAHSPTKELNEGIQNDEVKAITNDIWANSHEFDFDE